MKKPYKIVSGASTPNSREPDQLLIPLVELLEKGERAIARVLQMSAAQVAGPKEQGRRDADREVYWHGVQAGRVALKAVAGLRKKRRRADEPGEVEIPAYTALQADQRLADRMLELVLRGVSSQVRDGAAGDGRSGGGEQIRGLIEAGTRVLKELVRESWTCWWSTSTGSCSGTTTCWRRWAWMPTAASTCWGFAAGHRRTRRSPPAAKTWWRGACGRTAGVCSSSTAPRRCGRPSGGCSGRRWCNVVARSGTSWVIFRRSSTSRRVRRCGRRGSWTPTRASGSWSSTHRGWSGSGRRRRGACAKGCRSCSRSIALGCRSRCAAAYDEHHRLRTLAFASTRIG